MRISPKFLADLLTGSRGVVAVGLLGLAWQARPETLPWVVGTVVLAWSGDMADGWLAKKGGESPLEWLGKYDHEIDTSLAGATLLYLWRIGLVSNWLLILLLLVTVAVWYRLRSEWVWMSFNTGSHVVALTALLSSFPALGGVVIGWGAMVALAGRRRSVEMLTEARARMRKAWRWLT
jgi:phosphatidylglycerophosphate synthase